jgi:Flp pilus assembly pilin Flp
MNCPTTSTRAAVNVEYILLIVIGALAVVLGLGYLGSAISEKHIQVAEALSAQGATPAEPPVAAMTVDAPVENANGTYSIALSGGVPPYTVYREGVATTSTLDASVIINPYGVPTTYEVRDASGTSQSFVITTTLTCTQCHTMTDLNHTQHASLSCTSDCHTACRDMTTATQGDPLCQTCHAPALP